MLPHQISRRASPLPALASTGVLELNGADVTVGQSISQSDISDGALTFTPLANENGIGYDSFVYEVNDWCR